MAPPSPGGRYLAFAAPIRTRPAITSGCATCRPGPSGSSSTTTTSWSTSTGPPTATGSSSTTSPTSIRPIAMAPASGCSWPGRDPLTTCRWSTPSTARWPSTTPTRRRRAACCWPTRTAATAARSPTRSAPSGPPGRPTGSSSPSARPRHLRQLPGPQQRLADQARRDRPDPARGPVPGQRIRPGAVLDPRRLPARRAGPHRRRPGPLWHRHRRQPGYHAADGLGGLRTAGVRR